MALDVVPEHLRPVAALEEPVRAVYAEVAADYAEVVADLLASDVLLRPADVPTVEAMAVTLYALRRTAVLLTQSPPLLRGEGGRLVRNPALIAYRDLCTQFASLSDRLGMSPRARRALALDVVESEEDRRLLRLLS